MTERQEVAQVISPRINIGRWCACLAVAMWYGGKAGAWNFVLNLPGGRLWAMIYIFTLFGFAVRAGHDLLKWLLDASDALREKRKFQAMGVKAAIQWAHEKEMDDAHKGIYKGDPALVAKYVRELEEKFGISISE